MLHPRQVRAQGVLMQVEAVCDAPSGSEEAGKLRGRSLIAAAGFPLPSASSSSSSISILEVLSKRLFLIDSGADESVFPASSSDRTSTRTSNLIAANGTVIPTYGCQQIPVSFRPGHFSLHWFWIADVSCPIPGATFFRKQGLY